MTYLKRIYIYILALAETAVLTGLYYFFWRIGYTHGIPGYPEYLGSGKFVLMIVYALMTVLIMHFAGGFRFRRIRAGNIIIKQWGVMIAVNLITFLQLSLTAKHMVARRPMFDATVAQYIFIVLYAIIVDTILRRCIAAGQMLVIGDGIEDGTLIDDYRVAASDKESHDMTDLTPLFEKADSYDAVLIKSVDETTSCMIRHCLEKKIPVYMAKDTPLIYGVNRMKEADMNYVLVLGMDSDEAHLLDKVRAYLI